MTLGVVTSLSACAAAPSSTPMADLRAAVGPRFVGQLATATTNAERKAVDVETEKLLQGEIKLDAALKIALLNAPQFQGLYAQLQIAAAERDGAAQIANPVFSAQARPTFSPAPMANLEFGILTSLVDLLARPARLRGATSQYQAEKFESAAQVVAIASALRTAYVDYVGAVHAHAVQHELADAAAAAADLAEKFHAAGNIPLVRLREEQAAAADSAAMLADVELAEQEAREHLALMMGVDATAAWTVPSTLPAALATSAAEGSGNAEQRLDVQAARAAARAALDALKLKTDWRLWREIGFEVSGERDGDGQWAVGPKLEVALPLFNQGRPEVARAAAVAVKAQHHLAAVEQAAAADLRLTRARLHLMEQKLRRYRDQILPLHSEIVDLKLKEYNYMLLGAFDVLLARQATAAAEVGYVQALRDYWKARIALDAALGGGTDLAMLKAEGAQ
jgi:cobalt-zinc-cadmium efflux system outer membrane protein